MAGEWGRYGMRFNAIAPGPIETEVYTFKKLRLQLALPLLTILKNLLVFSSEVLLYAVMH